MIPHSLTRVGDFVRPSLLARVKTYHPGEEARNVDLKEKYLERIEDIVAQIREQLEKIPEGPERERFREKLKELERIVGEWLGR